MKTILLEKWLVKTIDEPNKTDAQKALEEEQQDKIEKDNREIITNNEYSRSALVHDMIEPFRWIVERSIYDIQDQIRKKDYIFSVKGVVVLSRELKKRYVDILSTILDRKRLYKGLHGVWRIKDGLQNMKESTIIKMKCFELKESLGVD